MRAHGRYIMNGAEEYRCGSLAAITVCVTLGEAINSGWKSLMSVAVLGRTAAITENRAASETEK